MERTGEGFSAKFLYSFSLLGYILGVLDIKKILLISFFIIVLSIIGCASQQMPTGNVVREMGEEKDSDTIVCNKPYIRHADDCCLDKNSNAICDSDEVGGAPKVEVKEEPEDGCGNGVCDEGEDCNNCQKDCGKCFSLGDLQADINKVIDWETVLTKEDVDGVADYYVHSEGRARLLGKYNILEKKNPTMLYQMVLSRWYILVSQIKDEKDYIKDSDEFYQYIIENNDYLLKPVKEARDTFQGEIKNGRLLELMFKKEVDEYKFKEMNSNETVLFDNVTQMETVGNKVVETVYVSVDEYEVSYQKEGAILLVNKDFSGINYEHLISIYCSPSLIITLYQHDNYIQEYYDSHLEDSTFFFDDIRHDRKSLLVDATALVSMCEQRYEFTYLRYR